MKHVAPHGEELEPVRLLAGGGTTHERRLLEAASLDIMPPSTPERLEQALSAWAALPAGNGSKPAPASRGWAVRWGIMGGVGGLALAGWLVARDTGKVALEVSPPSAAPVTAGSVAAWSVTSAPSRLPPLLATGPDHPEPVREPQRANEASKTEARPSASKNGATRRGRTERAGPRGNLLEEAQRLDRVRGAHEAGDGTTARRELAEYRSRFPRGELALEADVLDADLLVARQPERARTLANALLARPDSGRYRQRLEQLLQRVHTSERRAGSNPTSANMNEPR